MNVKSISFQANSIKNIDVIQKEKYKIKMKLIVC